MADAEPVSRGETNGNPEIGRELKVSELKVREVVVVRPPGNAPYITMWVQSIGPDVVVLYAGQMGIGVINFVTPEDSLQDDRGQPVHVFEYLGEV